MDDLFVADNVFTGLDTEREQRSFYLKNFNLVVSLYKLCLIGFSCNCSSETVCRSGGFPPWASIITYCMVVHSGEQHWNYRTGGLIDVTWYDMQLTLLLSFPFHVKRNRDIALRFTVKTDTYDEAFCYGVAIHWEAIVSVVLKRVLVGHFEYADTHGYKRRN